MPVAVVTRREVQETQCHKIEQKKKHKKKKRRRKEGHAGLMAAHTLRTLRVGFALSQGSQGEPLARELKTEAPKLHHNTMETMGTVEIDFLQA